MLTLFVVSDATGETAERMTRSALVQFQDADVTIIRRGQVGTPDQVRAVIQEAAGRDSLILHTLVSDNLRQLMLAESRRRGVDALDLMGPVLDRLVVHLRLTPREMPGLFKQLTEAKTREIEAVEFAFRHDDGQHPEDLAQAEVVLVGVSRTMKTPTMLYLAYRGWFAANVPIVPEIPPPKQLLALPADRVFCLEMHPRRLLELRRVRAELTKIPEEPYASSVHVGRELDHARQLSRAQGWQLVDVTAKSPEEVAREITVLLNKQHVGSDRA
jgi:regulator of PEP synthase PpsR (kinase-PPPase family)